MPPLDPDKYGELHDLEEAETLAGDIWQAESEALGPAMEDHLNTLLRRARISHCPACMYIYHVVYLGHMRVLQLADEREELDAELNDD